MKNTKFMYSSNTYIYIYIYIYMFIYLFIYLFKYLPLCMMIINNNQNENYEITS